MSDPVVHITNGVPDSGTGNITTLGAVVTALGTPMQASGGTVGLAAGTQVVGHVIVDTAPTTAITAAALPLPSGAATAALQPTAAAQGSTTSGQTGHLVQGAVTTGAPTYTTAQTSPLSLDTTGALRVNVTAGGAGGGAVTNAGTFLVQNNAATPAGTNVIGSVKVTDGTNIGTIKAASTAPVTATDTASVVVIRPDSPGVIATGTAGSASATVLSVQGITSMTPLLATATLNAETTKVIGTVNVAASQLITPVDQYAQYETVAASATAQVMGATGATGDYLAGVLVFPGTAAAGVVTILDNATTIGTFAGGGTTALPSLVPFMIPVGLFSVSGAWKITTGTNVTAVGIGKFT